MTSDDSSSNIDGEDLMPEQPKWESPRQAMVRELKERVARGEYWVDLDFLACLLVDSGATHSYLEEEPQRT